MSETAETFEVGEVVTIYADHMHQKRAEGKAKLIEKVGDNASRNKWNMATWVVEFVGADLAGKRYTRPILEAGVENKNIRELEDYSIYTSAILKDEDGNETTVTTSNPTTVKTGKRGRPPLSEAEKARRAEEKAKNQPAVVEGAAPKKRGRPALSEEEKAIRLAAKLEAAPKQEPVEGEVKRGRGRPRKNPVVVTVVTEPVQDLPVVAPVITEEVTTDVPQEFVQVTPQETVEITEPLTTMEKLVAAEEAKINPELEHARDLLRKVGLGNTEVSPEATFEAIDLMVKLGFEDEADALYMGTA